MTIQHHLSLVEFLHKYGHETLINATLSIVSITVIYSYLTIESFINYQLFRIWERRHDDSPESMAFLNLLGDPQDFGALKTKRRTRELGDRLKTLCSILGYNKIHEKRPELWKDFKELIEVSRHFFIHPYPGKYFQDNLLRIGTQTEGGKYVEIGSSCIIGAGCLVMQGVKIPDNSFVVGSPGKIKGEPTKQQLWWVQEGFKEYAELAKHYKKQGL